MTKILFLCHGNICRSPLAQSIFTWLVERDGLSDSFEIESAATSREEIGNGMYPPAQRVLAAHGVPMVPHYARQVTSYTMDHTDYAIIMDGNNARNMQRMFGSKYDSKTYKLMSFCGESRDVSDPWYTDDFETAYRDILQGCEALLAYLKGQNN